MLKLHIDYLEELENDNSAKIANLSKIGKLNRQSLLIPHQIPVRNSLQILFFISTWTDLQFVCLILNVIMYIYHVP
jgi:hypothetical protein